MADALRDIVKYIATCQKRRNNMATNIDLSGNTITADSFIGGVALTDIPAVIAGSLTGTPDGTMEDVAAIALSTTDTYTDAAVNTAVNTAITAINLQLDELQTKLNALINALNS